MRRRMTALLAAAAAVLVSVVVAPSANAHVPNRCGGWRVGVFDGATLAAGLA